MIEHGRPEAAARGTPSLARCQRGASGSLRPLPPALSPRERTKQELRGLEFPNGVWERGRAFLSGIGEQRVSMREKSGAKAGDRHRLVGIVSAGPRHRGQGDAERPIPAARVPQPTPVAPIFHSLFPMPPPLFPRPTPLADFFGVVATFLGSSPLFLRPKKAKKVCSAGRPL